MTQVSLIGRYRDREMFFLMMDERMEPGGAGGHLATKGALTKTGSM